MGSDEGLWGDLFGLVNESAVRPWVEGSKIESVMN